jgi:hypothetical protein
VGHLRAYLETRGPKVCGAAKWEHLRLKASSSRALVDLFESRGRGSSYSCGRNKGPVASPRHAASSRRRHALANTLLTDVAYHEPPLGVVMPRVSTPEQKWIGLPEQKYISAAGKKAPELGAFSVRHQACVGLSAAVSELAGRERRLL